MEKYKKVKQKNKFKISAPTWIGDYFECILGKHGENNDNLSIRIYVNQIKNRITFKIKAACYLKLLTHEVMKLLESIKNSVTKDENIVNVPHL